MSRLPLPHPGDPAGFRAVRTNLLRWGSSCAACALLRRKECLTAPCYSFVRPDGAAIHYVKVRATKAGA